MILQRSVCVFLALFASLLVRADITLEGQFSQGGLVFGTAPNAQSLELDNRRVEIDSLGRFIFGIGRDAPPSVTLTWLDSEGRMYSDELSIEQRDYQIQHIEGVPQKTVNPPGEVLQRIRQESRLVKKARAEISNLEYFDDDFKMPLEGIITGVYGSQRTYNGVPKRPHFGIDIAAPQGEPVYPPAAGIVTLVHSDMYYSGGTIIIDHGMGLSSTFIHLSRILVREGDLVLPDQSVGLVGSTGRSTGPHLDWRMNWLDVRIDPQLVLRARERRVIQAQ